MATEEELRQLREASSASAGKARDLLDEHIKSLMDNVNQMDKLKPVTADNATYEKLIAVVREATAKNHSIATLKANIQNLGEGAVSLAKDIAARVM